jgi:nitrogen regulatory protein PII-like uncharacterized protein
LATLGVVVSLASAGCASHYAYDFHLVSPGVHPAMNLGGAEMVEDADVRVEILVDVTAAAVLLDITNKTDEVLQVEWAAITLTCSDGRVTSLRPDVDLGWIQPHGTIAARLFAIALPSSGSEAAAHEGQLFQLNLPGVVRREPRLYNYALRAHVHKV